MHIDARQLENNSLIEGDICIVGAGAAGITMALEWKNTPYKVILLEGGGFDYDEQVQELYAGKTTGQHYFPLKSIRLHYFGGTTGHWAGWCAQFDEIDFKKRDWVPHSGWPITLADVKPYYKRAQPYVELPPDDFSTEHWQQKVSFQPFPFDTNKVWSKMWQFSPPTRFGTKYRDAIVGAKNIHLYTYANVVDIKADENVLTIKEVTVKNYAGRQHTVRAKYFILACCSIQNARLLLSANQQAKNGLGNDYDHVGRYFMEHLEIKTGSLWLADPVDVNLYKMDFGVTKATAELAIGEKMQTQHKILNGTSSLSPLETAENQAAFIEIWKDEKDAMQKSLQNFGKAGAKQKHLPIPKGFQAFQLFTRMEQSPNPDSRVTLDTEKDSLGMPRAKLNWALTSLEKNSLRMINRIIGQEVGRASMGRVKVYDYLQNEEDESWPSFTGGGWHHMGTTRMSNNPKQGVVDANCKLHSLHNLYVAGASCYATAGAVNPTLTLLSLTIRLADHLKQQIAKK